MSIPLFAQATMSRSRQSFDFFFLRIFLLPCFMAFGVFDIFFDFFFLLDFSSLLPSGGMTGADDTLTAGATVVEIGAAVVASGVQQTEK